ncbi:MAG: hypothetical protein WED04_05520 [Promethearchaeati archaeon SRVP18_Atabeyarchaeia-1]
MAEKPALIQLVKASAGLGDQAALAYKYILIVGSLTIGEVCEYTGYSYEVASKALDELSDKKLVRKLTQVVDRYVAVAPYRAFAELLVEFQRAMKELEENATKSVDLALDNVSKTNEQWKASAIKLREEQVSRAKQSIRSLKEEATSARQSLVEKLRRDTEAKKSSLVDMLKKHVDEHSARISDVEKDITLKVDNSVIKFAETSSKLKEQVSQTTTSYLGEFDRKLGSFLGGVDASLSSFWSEFSSYVEGFQGQTSAFIDDSTKRIRELGDAVKTKTKDLIHEVEQGYAQLSTRLQGTVSGNVNSTIEEISGTNRNLELNLTEATRIFGEKLNNAITDFQEKTRETIEGWGSAAKEEMQSRADSLKDEIKNHTDNLTQKFELAKNLLSELMKSHYSSAESASNDLRSNLDLLTESLKSDLVSETGSSSGELKESCEATAKECSSLVATLENLSKKNIPLASTTIKGFTSDVNNKLSKMTTSLLTSAKSFASEIKEKMVEAMEVFLTALPRGAPAESGKKGDEVPIRGSAVKKDVGKKIDEAVSDYVDGIKNNIDSLDKYASDRISAVMGFERELEKKWVSIRDTLGKVTELAQEIGSFPQGTSKIMSDLIDQYVRKADSTLISTKRLLNTHSTTLGDAMSNTTKKWNSITEKAKKEMTDLSSKRGEELIQILSKQISTIDKFTSERTKALAGLVAQKTEAMRSESIASQESTSRHIGTNLESVRGALADAEGQLDSALQANLEAFKTETDMRSKETDKLLEDWDRSTGEATATLKVQLATLVDGGKQQAKHVCESASSQLRETFSEQGKALHEIVTSASSSFGEITDIASKSFREEGESIKEGTTAVLSRHLADYTESVNKAIAEIDTAFAEHFEDCSRLTENLGQKLDELLTTHQDAYERSSTLMVEGLVSCLDQDEAAIDNISRRMLKEFTEDTTKTTKVAGSVENLMRTAWAEIIDTQQINADKTWHCVTKQAILHHIKDMAKRTKSTVTIVVPKLEEAPLKEVKEISKAIRINIIAGIDELQQKTLIKELLAQGNVRLWNRTEKDYMSCTRDAEEVIIAPVVGKDMDCVALVSVEEGFIKLIMKIVGPMWLASSKMVSLASLKP